MARPASSELPPPLPLRVLLRLLLLWLSWAPTGAGNRKVVVTAPNQVSGLLGQKVKLPCKLQPLESGVQVTQVTWMRREPSEDAHTVAVFHPQQGPSYADPKRLKFDGAKSGAELLDASLIVSGLREEDEANYTCEFATFPQGSGSARTWLRVLAEPQNQVDIIQENLPGSEPVAKARCISTGGRPRARISWFASNLIRNVTTTHTPGSLPGTFNTASVFIFTPSSQLSSQNVTCKVEHETFNEPALLLLPLTAHYAPEVSISGYDDNWYLGRKEATLSCDIRSNPEPTGYDWSTTTGFLPHSAVVKDSKLWLQSVDESANTTFICRVTNTVGTGQANLTVLLKDKPPGGSNQGLSTGIIISVVILVILVLVAAIVFWKKQGQWCGEPANRDCSYAAVSTQQDLQGQNSRELSGERQAGNHLDLEAGPHPTG